MKFPLFLLSISTLFLWTYYAFINVRYFQEGGRLIILIFVITLVNFSLISILNFSVKRIVFRHSFFFIIVLFIYFILKIAIDNVDPDKIKELTIGTSSGLLTSYFLGVSFSISFQYYMHAINQSITWVKLGTYTIFIASLFYLIMMLYTMNGLLMEVRSDRFLISALNGELPYQRAGILMGIAFLSLSVFLTYCLYARITKGIEKKLFAYILIALYIIIATFQCILSQLIGSNSSVLVTLSVLLITLSFIFVIFKLETTFQWQKIVKNTILSLVVGGAIFLTFIRITNFDLKATRLMGYNNTYKFNSADSRLKILTDDFTNHFLYSPVFGDFKVHEKIGKSQTYVHSFLLSIQTHLGLVGLILTFFYLFKIYNDTRYKNNMIFKVDLANYQLNKYFQFYTILLLTLFFLIANLTTFLHWMPIWFIFGFLSFPIVLRFVNQN